MSSINLSTEKESLIYGYTSLNIVYNSNLMFRVIFLYLKDYSQFIIIAIIGFSSYKIWFFPIATWTTSIIAI